MNNFFAIFNSYQSAKHFSQKCCHANNYAIYIFFYFVVKKESGGFSEKGRNATHLTF